MNKWVKPLLSSSLAALLGISLTLAFAPYGLFPLAIIAPAGLLLLWQGASLKYTFWLGYLFGLGWFGTGVYWVFISVHNIGGVPALFAGLITVGFIAFLSLFPACVGLIINRYFDNNYFNKFCYAFPATWVLGEWIRSWFLTGFPWLLIGYSQTNSPLIGFAPILSVYGVSLITLVMSGFLATLFVNYRLRNFRAVLTSLSIILVIGILGSITNMINWTESTGERIPLSLVQGNIPQTIKWSPEHLQTSLDRYQTLTDDLWKKDQLIIWPESAIPIPLHIAADFVNMLDQKARSTGSQLILGIPIKAQQNEGYYNAIISLGKDKAVYLKKHLVPFGEYVPMGRWLGQLLNFLNIPTSDLIPGRLEQNSFSINGYNILPSICYEIAFPALMNTNDPNIHFLLTLTNDAWFGRSAAQAQHLQMAMMRAAEFRRPIVVVSNNGLTALIGPKGQIEALAPPYQTFVLKTEVKPTTGLTPWMRFHMDPVLIMILSFLSICVRHNMVRKRAIFNPMSG